MRRVPVWLGESVYAPNPIQILQYAVQPRDAASRLVVGPLRTGEIAAPLKVDEGSRMQSVDGCVTMRSHLGHPPPLLVLNLAHTHFHPSSSTKSVHQTQLGRTRRRTLRLPGQRRRMPTNRAFYALFWLTPVAPAPAIDGELVSPGGFELPPDASDLRAQVSSFEVANSHIHHHTKRLTRPPLPRCGRIALRAAAIPARCHGCAGDDRRVRPVRRATRRSPRASGARLRLDALAQRFLLRGGRESPPSDLLPGVMTQCLTLSVL